MLFMTMFYQLAPFFSFVSLNTYPDLPTANTALGVWTGISGHGGCSLTFDETAPQGTPCTVDTSSPLSPAPAATWGVSNWAPPGILSSIVTSISLPSATAVFNAYAATPTFRPFGVAWNALGSVWEPFIPVPGPPPPPPSGKYLRKRRNRFDII